MVIRKFSAVIPALFMMIIALAGCKNDGSTAIPRETKSAEELAQLEKEQGGSQANLLCGIDSDPHALLERCGKTCKRL